MGFPNVQSLVIKAQTTTELHMWLDNLMKCSHGHIFMVDKDFNTLCASRSGIECALGTPIPHNMISYNALADDALIFGEADGDPNNPA